MTYDFPPPIPMSLGIPAFALCLFALAIVLCVCFGVFGWQEPISRRSRIRRSGVALLLASLIGITGLARELNGTQLPSWLAFWAILLSVIAVTTLIRRAAGRTESVSWIALAFLIALLLPAGVLFRFQIGREPNFGCDNNLQGLGIAHMNCAGASNGYLPDKEYADCSWRLAMLSYMQKNAEEIYDYSFDEPWDSNANLKLGQLSKSQFQCPANLFPTDAAGRYYTDLARITGPGTAFPRTGRRVSLTAIEKGDGLSQTLLLGECSGLNIVWTEPRDIDTATLKVGINLSGSKPRSSSSILSSYHRGGAYALFADGSVKFLSRSIDPGVLKAMTTINGGEPIDAP